MIIMQGCLGSLWCEAVVFTQTCRQLGLVLCCVCIVLCVYCVSHNMCLLYVVLLFCDLGKNMPLPLPYHPPLPAITSFPLHSSSPFLNPLTPLPSPLHLHVILPPSPTAPSFSPLPLPLPLSHDTQTSSWDHPRGMRQLRQLTVLKEAIERLYTRTEVCKQQFLHIIQ